MLCAFGLVAIVLPIVTKPNVIDIRTLYTVRTIARDIGNSRSGFL